MNNIGLYTQETEFSNANAGTAEWCRASRNGKSFFVKKFNSPVYPSKDLDLPEEIVDARLKRFHREEKRIDLLYRKLEENHTSGALLLPREERSLYHIIYQNHICTVSDYIVANVKPNEVYKLSEWQRLVLMRTLTRALMDVHRAGIVHSDVKPDNLLICQDAAGNCRLRLIDFDYSFFAAAPPKVTDDIHGDQAYFAPEVIEAFMGEDIRLDYRMDIFALGLVFHYLWCGHMPKTPHKKIAGEYLLEGGTVLCDDSVPAVIKLTIHKMLSVDPDERLSCEKIVYVLSKQIQCRDPEIVILHPVEEELPDPEVVTRKVEIIFEDEKGNVLGRKRVEVSKDFPRTVDVPKYSGYERKYSHVRVDWETKSPFHVDYNKKQKNNALIAALIILAILLIGYLLFGYSVSSNGLAAGSGSAAKKMSVAATPSALPVMKTQPPATPTPKPARTFSINSVTTNKGITTVTWTDSENKGPYKVLFQYVGGTAVQANFWAEENESSSTTSAKNFSIKHLISGNTYTIRVRDSQGKEIQKQVTIQNPGTFSDGFLNASSVKISTKLQYKSESSSAKEIGSFVAASMMRKMDNEGYSYGLYYKIEIPPLTDKKSWFTQIVFKAPNGYTQTEISSNEEYDMTQYDAFSWTCLGDYFFKLLYQKNGTIPTGKYEVKLYFNGMWVDTQYFNVE